MAVLELFREATIALDQPECFGELTVRWTRARSGHDRPTRRSDRPRRPAERRPRRSAEDMRRVTTTDGPDLGDAPELTDPAALEAALEALLLVVDAPTEDDALAAALDQPVARVRAALTAMAQRYAADGRGIDLRRVGDGWRFYTRDTYAPFVERLLLDGQRAKLTRAALETLAVVAYRQPVTRARVAAVRGVNCDGVLRTLVTRGLVEEAGVDGATQGTLFRTTELFLERLGLSSVDDLPPLAPLLPDVDAIDAIDAGLDDRKRTVKRPGKAGRRPAAEGAGPGRRGLPPRRRGAHRRGPGERRRQGRARDGPPRRPGHRRRARRRRPRRAARRRRAPGAEQAVRDALDHVGRPGSPVRRRPGHGARRADQPGGPAVPRRAASTPRPRACCC